MTPEEAQGLDYADSTDVADTLEMLRSLRTVWLVCRGPKRDRTYWDGWYWHPAERYAARFESREVAIAEAKISGLSGYLLATQLIGPVVVE